MYRLHIVSTGIEIFCHFVASEEEEEEENWVSSHCRSICRKNAFNWRRERIVQWVKNESEWEAAEVATERMHSIEEGKGLFSRGRMECEWEEERFLTLMLLQESIQIKVDATAAAGRMLDFCRRKEDQVRTVLSRVCFICLVFPCIMILQHQLGLLLLSHSTDPAANCLSRRRWEKSLAGISSDALSSPKTERLIALVVRSVCVLSCEP
jgi:hypothetical protein